ncbi:MAG: DUF4153 domain-containing protein [Bacteroidota bacterium]
MKKNDYLLLIATAAYSILFYKQNAGINFLLFNLIFIAVLAAKNQAVIKSKKWWWAATMCIISSVFVFVHSSILSVFANIVGLLLVSALTFNATTSSLFSLAFSGFSVAASVVFILFDWIKRFETKSEVKKSNSGYKIAGVILVFILSIMFFNMYKDSNPLFAENTKWINLDFISFKWIGFTILGFILLYGLFHHRTIPQIEEWENKLSITNSENLNSEKANRYEAERFAGVLLFLLLNAMLLILNFGDVFALYFGGGLPQGVSHSDFVHSGVSAIILSIIIAVGLMMFLYRNEFSTIKNNKILTLLLYVWIIQNVIMLSSTVVRNNLYIEEFNLTYRRIGVYIWLLLSAIGLVVTFLKILKKKSNWYLIKINFAACITVLTLSSCINWDKSITKFNLNNKPISEIDFNYLLSLSDTNIPELLEVYRSNDLSAIGRNKYQSWYYSDFNETLNRKITNYLAHRVDSWKSFDLRDREIYSSIYKQK